jgi:chemotaxis protein methyltransferase CheR
MGKKELVRTRLSKMLRTGHFSTFKEYIDHVLKDETGKEFSSLIDLLSTNLTSFFREEQHFKFMRSSFLPLLLEQKRKDRNFKIRGWSAGCSSGEEAYSIGITLLDAVQGQSQWDIKVLATDISTSMLDTAQKGIYNKQQIGPVSPLQKQKYLLVSHVEGQKVFEVSRSLRNIVVFKHLNLMGNWLINPCSGRLDFIFCRNVMIYFDRPTQQRLINRFWDLLASGGILFTGHSESLAGLEHKFHLIEPTVYTKQ